MPANIEVKARVLDPIKFMKTLMDFFGEPTASFNQEDIFFSVPKGRLKMRCENESYSELIYYCRKNIPGPTQSNYFRTTVNNPEQKKNELEKIYGLRNTVKKNRTLFLYNNTRIHLDDVDGLGVFLEIEVPITNTAQVHRAMAQVHFLMARLNIDEQMLIADAYAEL